MDDGPQLVLLFGVTCLTIGFVHTFLLALGVGTVFGMGLLAVVVVVFLDLTETGEPPAGRTNRLSSLWCAESPPQQRDVSPL